MRVAIRTDASGMIGSGHVMRCLTLAEALKQRGAICSFICRQHKGHLIELIRNRGFEVLALIDDAVSKSSESRSSYERWLGVTVEADALQTINAIDGMHLDLLIVDHYALDATWELRLKDYCSAILVIDDLANRKHECDFILDQNFRAKLDASLYENLVPTHCQQLLGPSHALINPVFALVRNIMPSRDGLVRRVLVFMGGSDLQNLTAAVVRALLEPEFDQLLLDVVIGVNHPDPNSVKSLIEQHSTAHLHRWVENLAGFMARSDLMIGGGGVTNWERFCLGLPATVIGIAENQHKINSALDAAGYIQYLGMSGNLDSGQIARAIMLQISDAQRLRNQSTAMQELVDGLGAMRVVDRVLRS